MAFLDRVLDPPRYGFTRDGKFYRPTQKEILSEFFWRLNFFRDRRNWLSFFGWAATLSFAYPLWIFLSQYFSFSLVVVGFIYSMVILGSHGTVWLHRYGTHRAFKFQNNFFRTLCRNLVIKIIPEETYIVSHYVHHQRSEEAGDPYNVHGGWLYCFLADVNHQAIARDLSPKDYAQVCQFVAHTGVKMNTYEQYQRWGSICHPLYTLLHYSLNWTAWYLIFFWLGGHALAVTLFGWAGVWAVGVRTFNFHGHGGGKDLRKPGIDFHTGDLSVNQVWPGFVAGEWHNNHHLYPSGARSGFLPYQIDFPWIFIWTWHKLGFISSYRDFKPDFIRDYLLPYQKSVRLLSG